MGQAVFIGEDADGIGERLVSRKSAGIELSGPDS